jgi:hypothetical protein
MPPEIAETGPSALFIIWPIWELQSFALHAAQFAFEIPKKPQMLLWGAAPVNPVGAASAEVPPSAEVPSGDVAPAPIPGIPPGIGAWARTSGVTAVSASTKAGKILFSDIAPAPFAFREVPGALPSVAPT